MKGAVEQQPAAAGIQLANWSLRQAQDEGGAAVCLRTVWHQPVPQQLPELASPAGVCLQAPNKRLVKGNESKREAFVAEYAALWEEAQRTEARIFFADEAHFRADAELRGKWVLKGKPALVDSNSPRYVEKASYYSAVCLETGEVEWMELEGNSNSGTSVAFLTQLKEKCGNGPRTRAKGLSLLSFDHRYRRGLEAAEISGLVFHDLRHHFATALQHLGVNETTTSIL